MITRDDALLLFAKWKGESTHLKVLAYFPLNRAFLNDCRLFDFSADLVALVLPGDRNGFEIFLDGLVFEYGEPPEGQGEGTLSAVVARGAERERTVFFIELDK